MVVARNEIYRWPKQDENGRHRPLARVRYVVRADPWGHTKEIRRGKEEEPE
jgi:hypothetical protein